MDQVQIQLQDETGNWRTYQVTLNHSQYIISGMRSLQSQFPNSRIRTIDMNGRLIDML